MPADSAIPAHSPPRSRGAVSTTAVEVCLHAALFSQRLALGFVVRSQRAVGVHSTALAACRQAIGGGERLR